ncbi:DUF6929 family protein [Flavobacterium sp. XGLA_31]|uniref:DUF6929 family protein n=1 Tax=Flavobacterium sp. XGLA_31 TaxID=3447666 RepID=UPI003F35E353
MGNFELSTFIPLKGISSASGLVYTQDSLFILSDSGSFLYLYDVPQAVLSKIPLTANSLENIPKQDKLDFEAITLEGNQLHLFGSGSTAKRELKFTYDLATRAIAVENMAGLYQDIKSSCHIADDELNIEGALYIEEKLHLFQRGNGSNAKNGIIIMENPIRFLPVNLPPIQQVATSFTDAIVVGDKIYFLAAAEDTASTYDDGAVLGSILGCLDRATFTVDFTFQISDTHKFEGLTLYRETETQIEFLLCEDNDTEASVSFIYKLRLSK